VSTHLNLPRDRRFRFSRAHEVRALPRVCDCSLETSLLDCPVTPKLAQKRDQLVLRGESAILGSDGPYIVEPVLEEQGSLLEAIDKERVTLESLGEPSPRRSFIFDVEK